MKIKLAIFAVIMIVGSMAFASKEDGIPPLKLEHSPVTPSATDARPFYSNPQSWVEGGSNSKGIDWSNGTIDFLTPWNDQRSSVQVPLRPADGKTEEQS